MARIEGSPPRGMFQRLVYFMMRRMLGRVPEPSRIAAHSKPAFKGRMQMERAMMALKTVPPGLLALGQLRTAQLVGCPF